MPLPLAVFKKPHHRSAYPGLASHDTACRESLVRSLMLSPLVNGVVRDTGGDEMVQVH